MARELAILVTAKNMASGVLKDVRGDIRGIQSEAKRGVQQTARNLTFLGGAAAAGLGAIVVKAVKDASDLNEEIDKSTVVFGSAADEVQRFADGAAAIGLSKAEALGAAGAFGNMFRTTGLAEEEAGDMSTTMVQLAADMASFNNEDPTEMLDKLRSGLSGEAEPLRRFGVLLSEASVKTFAYENGIAKSGEALTEAQKVQARYGLILEQTAIQQGNFADTSGSLANQQRTLRANLSNTSAVIGQALLPKIAEVTGRLSEMVNDHQPEIEAFAATLPGVFDDLLEIIESMPWDAIKDSMVLMGQGAKAALDLFTGMPSWVQTAVLTGWGLNKLSGGALGNIVGQLASGLVKGVLGINAGVVNINAGTVNGPGGGVGGAGGGGLGGFLSGALLTGGIAGVTAGGLERTAGGGLQGAIQSGDAGEIASAIDFSPGALIAEALDEPFQDLIDAITGTHEDDKTEQERQTAANEVAAAAARDAIPWAQRIRSEIGNQSTQERTHFSNLGAKVETQKRAIYDLNAAEGRRSADALSTIRGQSGLLQQIRDKRAQINLRNNVNVNVPVFVSGSMVAARNAQAIVYNGYENTAGI